MAGAHFVDIYSITSLKRTDIHAHIYTQIYIYKCVCMHVCTCIFICVHMCICMYMYIHVQMYVWINLYLCICMHIYVFLWVYVHVCVCMCINIYIYIYMYIHTYTYVYTFIYTHSSHLVPSGTVLPPISRPLTSTSSPSPPKQYINCTEPWFSSAPRTYMRYFINTHQSCFIPKDVTNFWNILHTCQTEVFYSYLSNVLHTCQNEACYLCAKMRHFKHKYGITFVPKLKCWRINESYHIAM